MNTPRAMFLLAPINRETAIEGDIARSLDAPCPSLAAAIPWTSVALEVAGGTAVPFDDERLGG